MNVRRVVVTGLGALAPLRGLMPANSKRNLPVKSKIIIRSPFLTGKKYVNSIHTLSMG
jgi:hypothetical protein